MQFSKSGNKIRIIGFEDKKTGDRIVKDPLQLFELKMQDGMIITSDDFTLVKPPVTSIINGDPASGVCSERANGKKYEAELEEKKTGLKVY